MVKMITLTLWRRGIFCDSDHMNPILLHLVRQKVNKLGSTHSCILTIFATSNTPVYYCIFESVADITVDLVPKKHFFKIIQQNLENMFPRYLY